MTPTKAKSAPAQPPSAKPPGASHQQGWDPFEVWRTRVLLPRLAETDRDSKSPTPIRRRR